MPSRRQGRPPSAYPRAPPGGRNVVIGRAPPRVAFSGVNLAVSAAFNLWRANSDQPAHQGGRVRRAARRIQGQARRAGTPSRPRCRARPVRCKPRGLQVSLGARTRATEALARPGEAFPGRPISKVSGCWHRTLEAVGQHDRNGTAVWGPDDARHSNGDSFPLQSSRLLVVFATLARMRSP